MGSISGMANTRTGRIVMVKPSRSEVKEAFEIVRRYLNIQLGVQGERRRPRPMNEDERGAAMTLLEALE